MYNLLAKAVTKGRTTYNRQDVEETAAAAGMNESDNTPALLHAIAPQLGFGHVREEGLDDPLIYRLQHQQRYLREKKSDKRSEKLLRRSHSSPCSSERDPFDLGESFTSEDASLRDPSNLSVDVVGWGDSNNSFRRKGGSHSGEGDQEEAAELYVDFGGVTPRAKAGKTQSSCTSDAIQFSHAKYSSSGAARPASGQSNLYLDFNHQPRRTSTNSTISAVSSVTKFSSNNSYISGNNDGRRKHCSTRPSHEDLSQILSSLERETFSSTPEPQQTRLGAVSCDSTLSSPTSKCRRPSSISSSQTPESQNVSLPPPLSFKRDQQGSRKQMLSPMPQSSPQLQLSPLSPLTPPQQRQTQKPKEEEEEDPRMAQLKQQSTNELRMELVTMQAQSKTNLENSWAETERMRVENSELDDEFDEVKRKLALSRAALLSGNKEESWRPGTPLINCANNEGKNKGISPIPTTASAVDMSENAETYSPFVACNEFRSMPWKASVGKSYSNKKNHSAGAANALMSAIDGYETPISNKSCSGKPSRGFLADLGKPFRRSKSSGGCVKNDNDFGCGEESDIDGINEKQDLNDESYNLPQKSPTSYHGKRANNYLSSGDDACTGENDSSCARSKVFYAPPDEEEKDGNHKNSRNSSLPAAPSITCSEMDDFDFDPLSDKAHINTDQGSGNKSVNGGMKERSVFKRSPSLMSLFDDQSTQDEDNDDSVSLSVPFRQKEYSTGTATELIQAKEDEIEQLINKIRIQVTDMRKCEGEILRANLKSGEVENQLKPKESLLQKEMKDLEVKDSGMESKLDLAARSERNAKETENALKERLAKFQDEECEVELETRLACYQEQYNASQENAINSLSILLNDFEAMCIPSLRGELEDGVCGDIIARFDDLTDKEEELVKVLSDSDRLTSCQALFQQIQKHIETAMSWQNQLGHLETDLHSYLVTITMLIKQDDEGTHTTESSTASERLSLERVFVEAIILHLGSVKQKQGKLILDALFKGVAFLTNWDEWLLPDFDALASTPPTPTSDCLGSGVNTIAMLKGVVKKASAELVAVKSDILNEQTKFRAKMKSAGLSFPDGKVNNVNTTTDNDNDDQCAREYELEKLDKQISGQISALETILFERESLVKCTSLLHPKQVQAQELKVHFQLLADIFEEDNGSEQLEELDKEISSAAKVLSEKESLRNKYSLELGTLQDLVLEETKAHKQMLYDALRKMEHLLAEVAKEGPNLE